MRFDHLSVPVADPVAVAAWFREVFQTEVLFESDEWVFLRTGDTKIAFVNESQHPAHFAMVVPEREEFEMLANSFGKEILTERSDTLNFYITGPEQVCVEFVYYLENFDVDRTR